MSSQEPSYYDRIMGFLQAFDLMLNLGQTSNDELLKELRYQDEHYLKTIIEQNKEIIKLLKEKRG